MGAYRKASIRELTSAAYELEGRVLQGVVRHDNDKGWMVGSRSLEDWLESNEGHDISMIMISMDEDRPMDVKVCRTCGREYVGVTCPTCREARRRLRGH